MLPRSVRRRPDARPDSAHCPGDARALHWQQHQQERPDERPDNASCDGELWALLWQQHQQNVGAADSYALRLLAPLAAHVAAVEQHVASLRLRLPTDLATGFPFYNAYYRLLGRKSPQETAEETSSGLKTRLLAGVATAVFTAETRWSTPWGGREALVARRPIGRRGPQK